MNKVKEFHFCLCHSRSERVYAWGTTDNRDGIKLEIFQQMLHFKYFSVYSLWLLLAASVSVYKELMNETLLKLNLIAFAEKKENLCVKN